MNPAPSFFMGFLKIYSKIGNKFVVAEWGKSKRKKA
jgi:hypothetical protein